MRKYTENKDSSRYYTIASVVTDNVEGKGSVYQSRTVSQVTIRRYSGVPVDLWGPTQEKQKEYLLGFLGRTEGEDEFRQ